MERTEDQCGRLVAKNKKTEPKICFKDNYLHGVGGEATRETLVLRQWAASQENLGFIN